jgi:hypothetical protein
MRCDSSGFTLQFTAIAADQSVSALFMRDVVGGRLEPARLYRLSELFIADAGYE